MEKYFSLLGVDENSTIEEIKKAYKAKVRQTHPDKFADEIEKKNMKKYSKQLMRLIQF